MKKNIKKVLLTSAVFVTMLALSACQADEESGQQAATQPNEQTTEPSEQTTPAAQLPDMEFNLDGATITSFLGGTADNLFGSSFAQYEGFMDFDYKPGALERQIAPPAPGEVYAVIHTSMGEIHARLFPEYAPMAVGNFVTHAQNGYFDGLIFHRVIQDFMIQGGCDQGTGMGGQSIWGSPFANELTTNLRHINGALSMANTGHPVSNGSQFFVVQNHERKPISEFDLQQLTEMQGMPIEEYFGDASNLRPEILGRTTSDLYPLSFLNHYHNYGGTFHLDFAHTVFGQVFYGMDVVNAIANTPATSDRPNENVYINTVEMRIKD